jgi:hypothetical protein
MLKICLGLMFLFTGCGPQHAHVEIENAASPQEVKTKISKEQALEIAEKEAVETHSSLEGFNVVACRTARVWLIIYDGGGPGYVISNESGVILGVKKIPQGPEKEDGGSRSITEQAALDLAKREAVTLFGNNIGRYDVFACELSKAWLVSFEYRQVPGELLPNSRSPLYVIDKRAGKVIYKEG